MTDTAVSPAPGSPQTADKAWYASFAAPLGGIAAWGIAYLLGDVAEIGVLQGHIQEIIGLIAAGASAGAATYLKPNAPR